MNLEMYTELTQDIKKLHALEDAIIMGEPSENRQFRSRQALLISEVIQSLQRLQLLMKAESQITMVEHQTVFS